jgi:hypothetical protein
MRATLACSPDVGVDAASRRCMAHDQAELHHCRTISASITKKQCRARPLTWNVAIGGFASARLSAHQDYAVRRRDHLNVIKNLREISD